MCVRSEHIAIILVVKRKRKDMVIILSVFYLFICKIYGKLRTLVSNELLATIIIVTYI